MNAGNDDERNRVNDHHENHGTDRTHEILHDFVSYTVSDQTSRTSRQIDSARPILKKPGLKFDQASCRYDEAKTGDEISGMKWARSGNDLESPPGENCGNQKAGNAEKEVGIASCDGSDRTDEIVHDTILPGL